MKDAEDEAFDDIARKQGAWGSGYQAKRKMAADKLQEPEREALKLAIEALEESQTDNDTMEFWDRKSKAITAIKAALAQPPLPVQEPVACERCKQLEEQAYDLLGQLKVANLKWSVAHPWVDLTDEEIDEGNRQSWVSKQAWESAVWWASEKLKEKNT